MSVADAAQAPDEAVAAKKRRRKRITRIIQGSISFIVVVAIFGLVIPKIANYSSVWRVFTELTWLELAGLVLATVFNLITYWLQMMAAMPGLTWGQAAVNNQTTTTIANILPGGGAIAVGLAVAIFRSWGFSASAITLEITLTGIWNSFMKLGLPIIALACVAITGGASAALITPAIVGLIILAGCVAAFALMLSRKRFARGLGSSIGRFWSWIRGLFHKPPATDWGDRAVRFRHDTIALLGRRWIPLTLTTVVSHLALYLVLLLALRDVGVSGEEISWAQILAVFAFGRLITALPITPGGLGLVEAAYITAFIAIGKSHADVPLPEFKAQVAAAVLLFRTLTFGIQIPLGGFTYIIWRAKKSWRRPPPDSQPAAGPAAEAIGAQPVPG
jgi:uncharacterized membrane protein YbhN (UPF0104 family)